MSRIASGCAARASQEVPERVLRQRARDAELGGQVRGEGGLQGRAREDEVGVEHAQQRLGVRVGARLGAQLVPDVVAADAVHVSVSGGHGAVGHGAVRHEPVADSIGESAAGVCRVPLVDAGSHVRSGSLEIEIGEVVSKRSRMIERGRCVSDRGEEGREV